MPDCVEFLKFSQPLASSGRFVLGAFEERITIYRQQVRALNLVYALHQTNTKKDFKVAIVGGGFGGVTAAAAAAELGIRTILFEAKPTLIHLQKGCDIRWIHPHIYHWPLENSDMPYAGLPFLSWEESTAGDVARQVLTTFYSAYSDKVQIITDATIRIDSGRTISWSNANGAIRSGSRKFDAIIFAVGFGVERGVKNGAQSYWRNDSINQISPVQSNEKTKVLVSGTGDGGLTDLLRACIADYHQARLLRELFPPHETKVYGAIRKVVKEWEAEKSSITEADWLHDKLSDLADKGTFKRLKARLQARLRTDTEVVLNGRASSFEEAITLQTSSAFNAFLAYNLYSMNAFVYRSGACVVRKRDVSVGSEVLKFSRVASRHGTDRNATLISAGFIEAANVLRSGSYNKNFDSSQIMWPPGWWSENSILNGGEKIEFVPPATQLVATTFVSTLSDILERHLDKESYRLTLHRLLDIRGTAMYQQICRYCGNKTEGAVGRVYPVRKGLVGLASRLGKPVLIQGNDRELAVKALGASEIGSTPLQTMLAVPFLKHSGRSKFVSLVLFVDTGKTYLVNNGEVLQTIYDACRGFVRNIEDMKKSGEIYFPNTDYRGFKADDNDKFWRSFRRYKSLEIPRKRLKQFEDSLVFESVTSFNADFPRY
jgi:hypothetical protein